MEMISMMGRKRWKWEWESGSGNVRWGNETGESGSERKKSTSQDGANMRSMMGRKR
jgi:hypothetical protein